MKLHQDYHYDEMHHAWHSGSWRELMQKAELQHLAYWALMTVVANGETNECYPPILLSCPARTLNNEGKL